MSQRNVERAIGRLVTDEAFRRHFAEDPASALAELTGCGVELTSLELRVLATIDPDLAASFADAIDPRLQKSCIAGGRP